MPADIEKLIYVKEEGVPWHGLGTGTNGYTTSQQLLEEHRLDWNVEKSPVQYTADEWIDGFEVPNRYVLYRDVDAQPLGIVGPNYQPDAPKDIFKYADELVPDGIARWATAGTLWNGGFPRFFATMKLEKDWHIRGEEHQQYLLFHTDYNGQYSLQILGTNVRVVCRNTTDLALGKRDEYGNRLNTGVRIKHNAADREGLIEESLKQVSIVTAQMERFADWAEGYGNLPRIDENLHGHGTLGIVSNDPRIDIVLEIIAPKGFIDSSVSYDKDSETERKLQVIKHKRMDFFSNFWLPEKERNGDIMYSLYNAAVGYADYGINSKATGNNTRQEARNKSVLFGAGAKMKRAIHEELVGVK